MVKDGLLEGLNPEQLHAVTLGDHDSLVLAGAGSGKTRVLTTRIAWLIKEKRATPRSVLAVTFTNKAAKEMTERLCKLLPEANPRELWIGTFHGISNKILRLNHEKAELPKGFAIMDNSDQLSAIKRAIRENGFDTDVYPPKEVQKSINDWKEAGLRPHFIQPVDHTENVHLSVYRTYEAACKKEGCVDFAELLLRAVELLENDQAIQKCYNDKFSHILIDEFQDTNRIQYRWMRAIRGKDAVIMGVGDDDQSIYSFRGARVANMKDFLNENKGSEVIKLERNYRSKKPILDAANSVIGNNTNRLGKNLKAENGDGDKIRMHVAADDRDEAAWIAATIKERSECGIPLDQMAVLYRSNAQSRVVEHAFAAAGIPYKIYGGLRFFDRAEIKHAIAYLRLAKNNADNGAWLRVVNFPPRGIGAKTIESITEISANDESSFYEAAEQNPKTHKFNCIIDELAKRIEMLDLPEAVAEAIEVSGLKEHFEKDKKEGEERLENLNELIAAAQAFREENQTDDLDEFLAYASLEAGERASGDENLPSAQMMTVHASKGLEFDTVFVIGVEERLFPHANSAGDPEGLEEERRLMYVAITRAKNRLHISHALRRMMFGGTEECLPSRFIDEIPEDCRHKAGGTVRNFTPFTPKTFKNGTNVKHSRFGKGTVMAATGDGKKCFIKFRMGNPSERWVFANELLAD